MSKKYGPNDDKFYNRDNLVKSISGIQISEYTTHRRRKATAENEFSKLLKEGKEPKEAFETALSKALRNNKEHIEEAMDTITL